MPTILQINVSANHGSTGRIAEQINQIVAAQGWKTYIAYGRSCNPSQSELIHVGNMLQVYEHYAEHRLFDNDGLASRIATRQLIAKIDAIKPDIIHLHNIHDHWLNYRILFEYLNTLSTPIVWTQHDCWTFTGGCGYFDSVGCYKWQIQCKQCPLKKKRVFEKTAKHYKYKNQLFVGNKHMFLVPVSNWLASLIEISFLKEKPIKVIHNGINISTFKPYNDCNSIKKGLGIDDEFVILGVALPWSARKGMKDFFQLAEMLDDNRYKVVLVGLSEDQIANLPSNVIGIRRTSNASELANLYSMADLFCNLTYSDNYPTTNLEAMACGTPVLTYNTGGSVEAVTPETGWIVEQGDIEGVIEVIKQLQIVGKQKYTRDCRQRAEKFFNMNDRFKEYVNLYESLLSTKKTKG